MSGSTVLATLVGLTCLGLLVARYVEVVAYWLLLAGVVAAGVYLLAILIITVGRGVFSLEGLTYSFGLTGPGDLDLAPLVRLTTWTGLAEAAVAISAIFDHLRMRWSRWPWWARWALAHVSLVERLGVGVSGLAVALCRNATYYRWTRRNHPSHQTAADSDDFWGLFVVDSTDVDDETPF